MSDNEKELFNTIAGWRTAVDSEWGLGEAEYEALEQLAELFRSKDQEIAELKDENKRLERTLKKAVRMV